MKQVVIIGGGDAFATYEEYLSDLRNFKIESIDYFKKKNNWKTNLQETLGEEYEVLAPQMPDKFNAKYIEWKIWFEKLIPFLDDGVILVGHSLGASFLAKYLSEERFPRKILGTFLVSGPYNEDSGRKLVEFDISSAATLLEQQGGSLFLYHSKDDPVVDISELAKYQTALPSATTHIFDDRQHFNQESFPELVTDIKSL